jgi:hypothetical protein
VYIIPTPRLTLTQSHHSTLTKFTGNSQKKKKKKKKTSQTNFVPELPSAPGRENMKKKL